GVLLKDAVRAYATDNEAAALANLPGPLLWHEFMAPISQTLLTFEMTLRRDLQNNPGHVKYERYAREAKQLLANRKAVTKEIQEWLITELQNDRMKLYGYAFPRHPNDRPVKIPADLYDARFDNWGGSTVKGNGLEFVAVAIIELKSAPQIDIKPDDKSRPLIK